MFEQDFVFSGEKFLRGQASNNVVIPEGTWVMIVSTIFPEEVTITVNTYTPDSWQQVGKMRGSRVKTLTQVITVPRNTRIGVNTSAKLPSHTGTLLTLSLIPLGFEATTT